MAKDSLIYNQVCRITGHDYFMVAQPGNPYGFCKLCGDENYIGAKTIAAECSNPNCNCDKEPLDK